MCALGILSDEDGRDAGLPLYSAQEDAVDQVPAAEDEGRGVGLEP